LHANFPVDHKSICRQTKLTIELNNRGCIKITEYVAEICGEYLYETDVDSSVVAGFLHLRVSRREQCGEIWEGRSREAAWTDLVNRQVHISSSQHPLFLSGDVLSRLEAPENF